MDNFWTQKLNELPDRVFFQVTIEFESCKEITDIIPMDQLTMESGPLETYPIADILAESTMKKLNTKFPEATIQIPNEMEGIVNSFHSALISKDGNRLAKVGILIYDYSHEMIH